PVPAPGHVTGDRAIPGHLHGDGLPVAVAFDVGDSNAPVVVQVDLHRAHRRLHPMPARPDPAQMCQRPGEADGPVAAHPQIPDIVEEYDAGAAIRIHRLDQQGAYPDLRAPRLAYGRTA